MRILLIRSGTRGYAVPPPDTPSGLMYVASSLLQTGHKVEIRDLEFEKLGDLSPYGAVGITILSKARQSAFRLINLIKNKWPKVRLVAGGPHVSSCAEQMLEKTAVDAVVVGEGEAAAVEAFESDERRIFRHDLLDVNEIPFPAYDLVDLNQYYMQIARSNPDWVIDGMRLGDLRYAPIVASRGCFGRCTFCNSWTHWGLKIRRRSAESVVDELEMLNVRHGVRLISFNDNCFPSSKRQGMEVCQEIQKRGLQILWKADLRADIVDLELAKEMRVAGCIMPALGLESGSPEILANINKNLDLDKARESLLAIKEAGLIVYVLLMVGNCGESRETIQQTVDFLNEIKPHLVSWVRGVMVLPGTSLSRLAEIPDEFWSDGDDLPYYLKERTMDELTEYSDMLRKIEKDPIPKELVGT